jgi:hypothetical protein
MSTTVSRPRDWDSYPRAMQILGMTRRAVEGLVRDGKVRTLEVGGCRVRLYLPDCERIAASYAAAAPAGEAST